MMKNNFKFIVVVAVLASFFGCAGVNIDRVFSRKETPDYLQKGQQLEEQGDLLGALEQYKLALTVNPDNSEASTKKSEVQKKIQKAAQNHYKAGLKFQRRGQYKNARNEFLKTLHYQPGHSGALEMLKPKKQIQTERYVTHTVKPDESLSKIAMMYYGDYKKFPLIAQFNNLGDATKVAPGDTIKVPQVAGVPFLVNDKPVETKTVEVPLGPEEAFEEAAPAMEEAAPDKGDQELPPPEMEEKIILPVETTAALDVETYRDLGIELFEKKKYQEAIVEFNKVLQAAPEDEKARHYIYLSHYQPAMVLFGKRKYLEAKREFEEALKYNSECENCLTYITRSELEYKEIHYNKGLSFFANEQLKEAIQEWEMVTAVDPDYKEVQDHLSTAKRFLKKLEEIQKSSQ